MAEVGHRVSVLNREGEILSQWGEAGEAPHQFRTYPHGIWGDSHGDIYVSEVGSDSQLKKFIRRFWSHLGSDPELLRFGAHTKPDHEPPQPHCHLDLTRLKSLTDWTPTWSMQDGIAETIAQLRSGGITA